MNNIVLYWGESVGIKYEDSDVTAETVDLIIRNEDDPFIVLKSAAVADGVADLSLTPEDTEKLPIDSFKYMVRVNYSDGAVLKFPDAKNCKPENFPDFIVEEPLDYESES